MSDRGGVESSWGKKGRNTAAARCWLASGGEKAVGSGLVHRRHQVGSWRCRLAEEGGRAPPRTKLRATPKKREQIRQHHPLARPYWQMTRRFPSALPWGETSGETPSLGARGMRGGDTACWGGGRRDVPRTALHTLSLGFTDAADSNPSVRMLASTNLTRSCPPREPHRLVPPPLVWPVAVP